MSKIKFKNVKIEAIKTVVPQNVIDISNEIEYFENSEKKLHRAKKILGFGTRCVVDENTTPSDLAYEAAKQLIEELNIDKNSIDCLLFLSEDHDYKLPTTANVLHGLLGLGEDCAVMDISQGCSGYVYSLWLASSIIQSGASKRLLLLTADAISKFSYKSNRLIAPIFGDSGSATLLSYSEKENPSYYILGSRGKDWDKIVVPAGGSRLPINKEILDTDIYDKMDNKYNLAHMIMSGIDVFNFTMEYVPKVIKEILDFANISKDEISLFGLHQANKQIIDTIIEKAGLPTEKTPSNTFSQYGNNACNSIGVLLSQNLTEEIKDNVLLLGYGVGMSWASAIVNVNSIKNLGISIYNDTKNTPTHKELKEYWEKRFITKGE